ncbi:MAG: FAD-dependent oxidoreductase [Terrimicrobiaceae bacterium]
MMKKPQRIKNRKPGASDTHPSPGGSYRLQRTIPVEDGFDVVVAGGGPAGSAAAICAARLGARVLLVEATGCLGGMGTAGLVTAYDPMADGKKPLVGGLMREIVETLYERGQLGHDVTPDYWRKNYHCWTQFQAEGVKLLLDELTVNAGVDLRFFTRVIDADADPESGTVSGVILNNIEGYKYIKAPAFIDCTGDAVLATLCGAECREAGRDTPHPMPATLCSLHAGIDWDRWFAERPNQRELVRKAVEEGHFTQPDLHLPGMGRITKTVGCLNGGHVFNLDALSCRSLSDGIMLGRKIVQEYLEFYRKYVPGCENIELVATGALMGIRESRRVVGEYELTFDDYMARRQFADQIGVFNKFVDVHPYDTSKEEWERFNEEKDRTARLEPGECFGIPYPILVPKGWKNLWVAGRCNSSDVKVNGSIRVMPASAMMGQAAGTAAVQSLATGQPAFGLDTRLLVETLREHGAYLPQDETAEPSVPRAE